MATLKYYAQKDALGFPIPGTMMATTGNVPADSLQLPTLIALPAHPDGLKYIVRKDKKGNIIEVTAGAAELLTEDNFSLVAENEDLIIL